MKNLKEQLEDYLKVNGKQGTYREIYEMFPFSGNHLTNKQKGDKVRKVWNRVKKTKEIYQKPLTPSEMVSPYVMKSKDLPEIILNKKQPKILIYDLETSPLKSYVWSLWKQNVNPTNGQLQSQKMILSWSAKWLFEEEILFDHMFPKEIAEEDDKHVVESLWKLIDQADIVIAHNAQGFDVKVMNTRFLLHDLPPPTHYQVIDTLLHARKRFKLESNKLDYLGQILGLGKKHATGGFKLWVDCMNGSSVAMSKMVEYCNQDVKLLEAVYLKLRPWIKPHPPVNLIVGNTTQLSCPTCNSDDVSNYGTYTTYANIYPAHKCNACQSTFRSKKAKKIDKTNLTISTPN